MELKNYFTQDNTGSIVQGATCYLYQQGTQTLVTGLQTATGSVLSNPFVSDANGLAQFKAPNGTYDLRVVSGIRDYTVAIQCLDLSENILDLSSTLEDATDPDKGAGVVGWTRDRLLGQTDKVASVLSSRSVSVWEFAHLITSKPNPADSSTWDWTPAIAGAQAKAFELRTATYGGFDVSFPAGIYPVTRIKHLSGVSLRGMGSASTFITALPFDPADGKPYGLLELSNGPIQGAHISGIGFVGSSTAVYGAPVVNPNQWGFYCRAQYDTTFTQGGFWHSQVNDVVFWNFNNGIWSRGGYTQANSRLPIQWIDYVGVRVVVQDGGQPWLFTGQHGQISVQCGHGEGISATPAKRALYSVKVTVDPDPSTMAIDGINGESVADVSGVGNANRGGHNITFSNGFAFQRAQKGVWVDGPVRNITVNNCWFETLAQAVTMTGDGNISLAGNRFANAGIGTTAGGAAGSGYILTLGANSQLDYGEGNIVEGSFDHFVSDTSSGANECRGFNFWGSLRADATGAVILPTLPQRSPTIDAVGKIDISSHRFATVASNADKTIRLQQISSNLLPGQTITLRAASGSFTLRNSGGGNIVTGTGKDMTVPSGGIAVLLRIQPYVAGSEWMLLSVSEHYASAVPADGFYYTQGHTVKNLTAVAGVPAGWVCTTTGLAGTTAVFKAMANLV